MPSKSRSQQRLFQAAEHGATFAKAKKLRSSLTHQQLHDFASGSEKGKPQHVAKPMHPAMTQRAKMVAESHAHLAAHVPNFHQMPAKARMTAVQNHVRSRMGK